MENLIDKLHGMAIEMHREVEQFEIAIVTDVLRYEKEMKCIEEADMLAIRMGEAEALVAQRAMQSKMEHMSLFELAQILSRVERIVQAGQN